MWLGCFGLSKCCSSFKHLAILSCFSSFNPHIEEETLQATFYYNYFVSVKDADACVQFIHQASSDNLPGPHSVPHFLDQ